MRVKKKSRKYKRITKISGIPLVSEYKYLGVTFSDSLRPLPQEEKLKAKLAGFKHLANKLRPEQVDVRTRLQLWKTYFLSHLR